MKIVQFLALWFSAMSWHLWRIGTGRPAYRHMGDTKFTVLSFVATYLIAGCLRWTTLGGVFPAETIFSLALNLLVTAIIATRPHRSSGLFCALVGVSAAVDISISLAYLAGLLDTVLLNGLPHFAIQAGLTLVAIVQFHRNPVEVQASGFRPNKPVPALHD